jgi:hypothetical protein
VAQKAAANTGGCSANFSAAAGLRGCRSLSATGGAGVAAGETALRIAEADMPEAGFFGGAADGCVSGLHPSGGVICTKLPHFGQSTIAPMTSALRTASRARQVVQVIENSALSTVPVAVGKKSA